MRAELGPDFDGCGWGCRQKAVHCHEWGTCTFAPPPPCEHPIEAICTSSDGRHAECGECHEVLTVRLLAEQARVGLSTGCLCSGDCKGYCVPKAMAWNLDPRKVLAVLNATPEEGR